MTKNIKTIEDSIKYVGGITLCILLRLFTNTSLFPNADPIIGANMPYSQKYGKAAGAAFGFISLVSFDFITGRIGLWTIYCGIAYAALGWFAADYLGKTNKFKMKKYLAYTIIGVIAYDAVTASLFAIQFGVSLQTALIMQIPFTIYHLAGATAFTIVLSPIMHYAISRENLFSLNPEKAKN